MGKVIGVLSRNSTPGEKKIFKYITLKFKSDSTVFCYYEPLIGDERPDFLLLGPTFGVVVIEVKDYSENLISETPPTGNWTILKQ